MPELFVFDFDWTLVDEDSDRWVIQECQPSLLNNVLKNPQKTQWTDLMNMTVYQMYQMNTSTLDIKNALEKIPFDKNVITLFKNIKSRGGIIAIISDSNTFYIKTILEFHGIYHIVDCIKTNHAYFEENILRISRYIKPTDIPHGCLNCAVNICKGKELESLMNTFKSRTFYFGDGRNDFCPCLKLCKGDFAFPRLGRDLNRILQKNPIIATVVPWNTPLDIIALINAIKLPEMSIWLPLESNPEVLNKYAYTLGMSSQWQFQDVWSLDDDCLQFITRPVKAVVLLFPVTKQHDEFRKIQQQQQQPDSSHLFFIKQTIPNACGTIGLLHALTNNVSDLEITNGFVYDMFTNLSASSASERAAFLETSKDLANIHSGHASKGDTIAEQGVEVDLHFTCFIENSGCLWELDGRNSRPIYHGACHDLMDSSSSVIKKFMERDQENPNFTILALTRN